VTLDQFRNMAMVGSPFWVNNGPRDPETPLPLCLDQRTSSDRHGLVWLVPQATSCWNERGRQLKRPALAQTTNFARYGQHVHSVPKTDFWFHFERKAGKMIWKGRAGGLA
jgi:hypothetical protein